MKKIKIELWGKIFEINVEKIITFPNTVYLIEYSKSSNLNTIVQSPIYIVEKDKIFAFQNNANIEYVDLLMSISKGIEENYNII
jgi:hypothetical protein